MTGDLAIEVRPLDTTSWADLVPLFEHTGDARWCWCMYWRMRSRAFASSSVADNRAGLRALCETAPPGLIGYDASGEAIGWVSLGPRSSFERLERSRVIAPANDPSTWAIVCFVVAPNRRHTGVGSALLHAAVEYARERGAPSVEAYPVVTDARSIPDSSAYTGTLEMFEAAGFSFVALTASHAAGLPRALVRLRLGRPPRGRRRGRSRRSVTLSAPD